MFKTGDSVEEHQYKSSLYQRIDNEDILNGNIIDDCFEDINSNFVAKTQSFSDTSENNENNLILIGELNVLKV